jgi:hypothetical protein
MLAGLSNVMASFTLRVNGQNHNVKRGRRYAAPFVLSDSARGPVRMGWPVAPAR